MNPIFDKPFTFDRVMRIIFGVLALAGIVYLISLLKTALLPFFVAWLLAYIMQPLVKFFQYKLGIKNRILSIVALLISLALLLTLVGIIVVPNIVAEADKTLLMLRTHQSTEGHIPWIPVAWVEYLESVIDFSEIREWMSRENLLKVLRQIAPQLWSLLSNTFSILVSLAIVFVIFLYFIFILVDYEKIANGWIDLVPDRYRPFIKGLAEDMEFNMNRYFRGQSLIALCVAILLAAGFKIIDFPLGVTLGLFIGVLNLIPYLQTIGIIPMALLSLLRSAETGENFWIVFGMALAVLLIVQCIQDLYLTPRIMGKAMGLNPAIILLSLSVWGTLLGFIGLIVALPLTTLCLSYYKRFILYEINIMIPESNAQAPQDKEINTKEEAKK